MEAIAQKNFEDPEYDHSKEQWLTEEENKELELLLSKGFSNWKRNEYHSFIQACMDYGQEEYTKIAEAIQTKTVDEVIEYSKEFWSRGK